MDTAIIVAIITALGGVFAALITAWAQGRVPRIPRKAAITIAALVGLGIGFGVGGAVANYWACREPCLCAKLTAPNGARARNNAAAFQVPSPVEITWDKTDCVMTIEYYQKEKLITKYRQQISGQKINIGLSGSGETEIKIWWEGSDKPADAIWVSVR